MNIYERVAFNAQTIYEGHHRVTYRGIPALRCPFDYVMYQMIISKLKPDLVIEIGTNLGGGALYLADLMNAIGHGFVHTIDLGKRVSSILNEHPRIKTYSSGWEAYDLDNARGFDKIMVIEDSSHTYWNTLDVMDRFAPIVSVGSYLIVEDGIINELGMEEMYGGGPLRAIKDFLAGGDQFIVDRSWCNLFGNNATFNVSGYLLRIR